MNLKGRTFVVSGGASGIGRATVGTLCAAGATVFFGDINEEGGVETAAQVGDNSHFVPLDITSDESIANFAKTALGAGDVNSGRTRHRCVRDVLRHRGGDVVGG